MAAYLLAKQKVRVQFPYAPLEPSEMAIMLTIGQSCRFESCGTQSV
jgi:hypothetical protein